jgi:hypothetical protein
MIHLAIACAKQHDPTDAALHEYLNGPDIIAVRYFKVTNNIAEVFIWQVGMEY